MNPDESLRLDSNDPPDRLMCQTHLSLPEKVKVKVTVLVAPLYVVHCGCDECSIQVA